MAKFPQEVLSQGKVSDDGSALRAHVKKIVICRPSPMVSKNLKKIPDFVYRFMLLHLLQDAMDPGLMGETGRKFIFEIPVVKLRIHF